MRIGAYLLGWAIYLVLLGMFWGISWVISKVGDITIWQAGILVLSFLWANRISNYVMRDIRKEMGLEPA